MNVTKEMTDRSREELWTIKHYFEDTEIETTLLEENEERALPVLILDLSETSGNGYDEVSVSILPIKPDDTQTAGKIQFYGEILEGFEELSVQVLYYITNWLNTVIPMGAFVLLNKGEEEGKIGYRYILMKSQGKRIDRQIAVEAFSAAIVALNMMAGVLNGLNEITDEITVSVIDEVVERVISNAENL